MNLQAIATATLRNPELLTLFQSEAEQVLLIVVELCHNIVEITCRFADCAEKSNSLAESFLVRCNRQCKPECRAVTGNTLEPDTAMMVLNELLANIQA